MLRTAECISPKHPDKVCDRISDAILDACLKDDPNSRVAMESMGGHKLVSVTGELTTHAWINVPDIVHRVAGDNLGVQSNIVRQSPEIAQGVDVGGAGDQGIMVGFACNENEAMIPQELYLAREVCKYIYNEFPFDGKTQVTIKDGEIIAIVASFQCAPKADLDRLVKAWAKENNHNIENSALHLNPAGDWNIGGFDADTGLTGRKLAVDNYGPRIPIGGGAFSGKDATKVDRSAAYMARRIAVDLLRKNEANEVYVYLAYAIGVAQPVMATAIIDGTEVEIIGYDLTPAGIVELLDLKKPIFEKTAEWGHFGNGFTWDV